MTVRKTPLRWVSYSGDDPDFPITDEQFENLEAEMGKPIGPAAREELIRICKTYVFSRRSELARQTYQDVASHIGPLRKTAQGLWSLAYGNLERSNAKTEFDTVLELQMGQRVFVTHPYAEMKVNKFDSVEWKSFGEAFQLPEDVRFGIALSPQLIRNMAHSFADLCHYVEKEIEARSIEESGYKPQKARQAFFVQAKAWAKKNRLNHGAYDSVRQAPAKFSHFISALLSLTPEEYRENDEDPKPSAIAEQIRRALEKQAEAERAAAIESKSP